MASKNHQSDHPSPVILITGSSSGIGLDTARYFAKKGWHVIATCRKAADVKRMQKEGLSSFQLDYEDQASLDAVVPRLQKLTGGRIDVLFNNGAYAVPCLTEDLPTPALRQIFEANFFGWHDLTRQILPLMFAAGKGRIIHNSSVLGFAAMRARGAYNATKFALEGLTDTMRQEIAGTNIDLILVQPGPIRTRIRQNAHIQFKKWISWKDSRNPDFYTKGLIPRLSAENPEKDLFELMPDAVTRAVWHAATARRPKLRYRITWATKIMAVAKRILSTRLMDRFASRF
ncbi:SDR family NAD(P)-dependent oxidoreductase [Alphaproteobacteria bacterium]|jgi:NAD(P)-dependent dehydrogenase (short-subunit alcohol dehydrogenase family)|nr:SDR family NAD(P)-dependent oxidoreductase [Alphaproteobacteria bacterium]MDC1115440.1 SDR family NAD(P)-dependent oxidoreductase [Alphaproteobacteria bacterium]